MNRVARRVVLAGIAAYAGAVAMLLRPGVLVDDAAITFRYVERFAAGLGLTYNDHEHVLGLSNPLYALLLAIGAPVGVDAEGMARALALVLSAVVAVQTAVLAERLSGSRLALAAGVLLPLDDAFRGLMLGGMESGLATCLGLGMVQAILGGRGVAAAVLLGLAIWNKLDAALLAVAFAAAALLVQRALPIRTALISAVVVAPWWAIAWWYYGSPLPHSLSAKLVQAETSALDPLWVVTFFRDHHRELLVLVSFATFAFWKTWPERERLGAATLGLWFLVHAVTFSLFNLGAAYPWYLTVLIPPPLILATAGVAIAVQQPSGAWRLAGVAAAVAMLIPATGWARDTVYGVRHGNPVRITEAFEGDRRLSGVFLRQYSDPAEVVESGFGWVAAEAPNPLNDPSRLNSEVMRTPVKYVVRHGMPFDRGANPPKVPEGFLPLATFNLGSSVTPGFTWFVVYGSPDSTIARSNTRFVQLRLFELSGSRLNGAELSSIDLKARAPSDATFTVRAGDQPVTVIFAPAGASVAQPEGVTFSVWSEGVRVFEHRLDASGTPVPMAVRLPSTSSGGDRIFSLRTDSTAPISDQRLIWKDAKVVIGEAPIDLDRLGDPRLINAWRRLNPAPQQR